MSERRISRRDFIKLAELAIPGGSIVRALREGSEGNGISQNTTLMFVKDALEIAALACGGNIDSVSDSGTVPDITPRPNSTATFTPQNTLIPVDTATSTIPPTVTNMDLCLVQNDSGKLSRYLSGTPVPPDPLFNGNLEAVKAVQIIAENIISPENPGWKRFHTVLVPVGFQNPNEIPNPMENLINGLNFVYRDLPIDFSYLNINMPVNLGYTERLIRINNPKEVLEIEKKLERFYPVDSVLLVANNYDDDNSLGVGFFRDIPSATSLSKKYNLYVAAHETAHCIGLYDAYIRTLFINGIPYTTFFRSIEEMLAVYPLMRKAYENTYPPPKVIFTGYNCQGDPLYTFDDSPNIMSRDTEGNMWTNEKMLNGEARFSPLQMNYIRELIAERIRNR